MTITELHTNHVDTPVEAPTYRPARRLHPVSDTIVAGADRDAELRAELRRIRLDISLRLVMIVAGTTSAVSALLALQAGL